MITKGLTALSSSSNTLSGNRANPILNSAGKDDKNHSRIFRIQDITDHPDIRLTRGGMILIGLMSGGDYQQGGLSRCGVATAHALARCGFGDSLYESAVTLDRASLEDFLISWRDELCRELRTNSKGEIGRKQISLANSITEKFPDVDILLSYVNPITSESMGREHNNMKITWEKEPDLAKLAGVCELYFEWGYKEAIIKRFRTILWHSVVLRILRRAVLNTDENFTEKSIPGTPKKRGTNNETPFGTPSKMIAKRFSSLNISSSAKVSAPGSSDEEDEERLIVKIHSSRVHASTDGLSEYRLEVAPKRLVLLTESGIKGLRSPEGPNEWSTDKEGEGEGSTMKNGKKEPINPETHLRLWMPACIVRLAEPRIVSDYENIKEQKSKKTKGIRDVPRNGKASQKTTGRAAECIEPSDVFSAPLTGNPLLVFSNDKVPESSKQGLLVDKKAPRTLLSKRQELNRLSSPTDEESSYEYDSLLQGRGSKTLSRKGPTVLVPEVRNPIGQISSKSRKGVRDLTKKKEQLATSANSIKSFFPVTIPHSSATVISKGQPVFSQIPAKHFNISQSPIQDIRNKSPPSSSFRSSTVDVCATEGDSSVEYDMSVWGRNVPSAAVSPSRRKIREQCLSSNLIAFSDCSYPSSESEDGHLTNFRKEETCPFKPLDRPALSAHSTSGSKKSMDIIEISSESDSEEPLPEMNVPSKGSKEKEKVLVSQLPTKKKQSSTFPSDIIDLT